MSSADGNGAELFQRPDNTVFFQLANYFMPPAPANQVVFNFGDLKQRFRGWHYLFGLPLFFVFFWVINLEVTHWPDLVYTPINLVAAGLVLLWHVLGVKTVALLAPAYIGYQEWSRRQYEREKRRKTKHDLDTMAVGLLNSAAVREEQWFREGSEDWTAWQRFRSCACFGFVHLGNMFYPFFTVLPLSLGGYLFMQVYLYEFAKTSSREDAVLASALVHRVYNRIAIFSAIIFLAYHFLAGPLHLPKFKL